MKKYILSILSIILFSTTFISCSSDDDFDIDKGNSNHPQFVGSKDYKEYKTQYITNEETTYKNGYLKISFDFGPEYISLGDKVYIRADYSLEFKFLVDINTLKVGDELQSKLERYDDVKFKDNFSVDFGYENFIKSGKIIVKSIDTVSKKISVEFQNLDIWRDQYYLNGNNKEMKEFMIRSGILEFIYK